MLGATDENGRVSIADGRMLESPERITAGMRKLYQAAIECCQRRYASTEVTAKPLERLSLRLLENDRALQLAITHVDECERRLAVSVESLYNLLKKLLAPLHEPAKVVLVDEYVLREQPVGQATGSLWNEARMIRDALKVRFDLLAERRWLAPQLAVAFPPGIAPAHRSRPCSLAEAETHLLSDPDARCCRCNPGMS